MSPKFPNTDAHAPWQFTAEAGVPTTLMLHDEGRMGEGFLAVLVRGQCAGPRPLPGLTGAAMLLAGLCAGLARGAENRCLLTSGITIDDSNRSD